MAFLVIPEHLRLIISASFSIALLQVDVRKQLIKESARMINLADLDI